MLRFLPLLALSLSVSVAQAQIIKAPASPRAKATHQVGLIESSLDYGRPSVKGREIFGGLVPFGRVWRTGANQSTKISFTGDVKFGGQDVPAGDYALYTFPGADKWAVIIYRDTSHWGSNGYDSKNDVVRVEVPVQKLATVQESLCIDFDGFHADGANLVIAWEHVKVSVPVMADSEAAVMKDIDEKVRNAKGEISARTYFDAGSYLFQKRREMPLAAEWIDKAVAMEPRAFWMAYTQAEVAVEMGKFDKAKASAMKALELAEAANGRDGGYADRSRKLIEKLEKM